MKTKNYVLLVIMTILLSGTIAYGADPDEEAYKKSVDEVREAFRRQREALYDYHQEESIATYRRYLLVIVIVIAASVYISKAIKKEKKEARNAVRDVIRTELDSKISSTPKLETCENCGRTIGKLEKSYVFEGQTVCGQCHQRLESQK